MSQDRELLNQMDGDLRRSQRGRVVYLEGKTDVPIFFALLGLPLPPGTEQDGYRQDGCLVRGLTTHSGKGGVRKRIELAQKTARFHGRFFGFVDGDGETSRRAAADELSQQQPLLTWPTYCIENLLVQAPFPPAFGPAPDWPTVFLRYRPYVALSRIHRELQGALAALRLPGLLHPNPQQPLCSLEHAEAALQREARTIDEYRVLDRFHAEVSRFEQAVQAGLPAAHALLDGKWLVQGVAHECGMTQEDCQQTWQGYVAQAGGHPQIRPLWPKLLAA